MSVFWASKPAVAIVAVSSVTMPQNPDVTAGPLSRQSSGGHPRLSPQTSTADDSSLLQSQVQVLAGAPREWVQKGRAPSVGESTEGGKRNKRVGESEVWGWVEGGLRLSELCILGFLV